MQNIHKLIALLLAVFAITSYAQTDITAKFTDPNFKAAVYSLIGKTDPAPILDSDVSGITILYANSRQITSLAGIEYFTALTGLQATGNRLTTLDVSKNTALTYLNVMINQLTTLDVSKNTALTDLNVGFNQLTTLDVSKNTELTILVADRNQLTTLDVSKNTELTSLVADWNQLTTLDVSKNTALTELYAIGNQLTTLDLSGLTELTNLNGNTLPKPTDLTATYGKTLADVEPALTDGWSWQDPTTPVGNAGTQTHPAKYTIDDDPTNYKIPLTITVEQAPGTFPPLAVNATYTPTLKLSDVPPPANYAWVTPATTITVAGNNQPFPAKYTDPSGNYTPASGNITVNVAQATGTFTAPAALSTTYTPTLKLSDVTPPANYAWVTPATTIIAAGNNQAFPAKYTHPSGNYLVANGNITVNVAQATGLENDAPPVREISASNTNPHQYDLTLLAFKQKDHGAQTYELGEFKGTTSILAAKPSLGADGHTITYTGTGKETGEATLEIIVKSANYTNTTATITFKATKKEEVTISGITLVPTYTHDGTPKNGYDGTPTGTNASTGATYTGEFLIEWAGTNLPQGTTPPTQPGEYTIKISLKDPNYTGVWSKQFTITEATDPIRLPQVASSTIRIQSVGNSIILSNLPTNARVEVYNLQGKRIYSAHPENHQILTIKVQTKGMYIVKAGNQTLRVAVK